MIDDGRKLLVLSILILGASGVLAFSVGRWAKGESSVVQEEIGRVLSNEQKHQNLTYLRGLVKDIAGDQKKIDRVFADESTVVELIDYLENLGRLANAKVSLVSLEGQDRYVINFQATGSFANISQLINLVETARYHFEITGASMEALVPGGNVWRGNFSVVVLTTHK